MGALGLLILLWPAAVLAAKQRPTFAMLDKNNDGTVTADELQAYAEQERNAHFEVRRSKMLVQNRKRLPALIKRLDKDGDNALSKDEFPPHAQILAVFDEFDGNNDGKLEVEEFMEYTKASHTKETIMRRAIDTLLQNSDKTQDGQLSEQEFNEASANIEHAFFHASVHHEL